MQCSFLTDEEVQFLREILDAPEGCVSRETREFCERLLKVIEGTSIQCSCRRRAKIKISTPPTISTECRTARLISTCR